MCNCKENNNNCGCKCKVPFNCVLNNDKSYPCLGVNEGDTLEIVIDKVEELCLKNESSTPINKPDGLLLVDGELSLTSNNDSIIWDSVVLPIVGTDSLIDNGDGTYLHTSLDGVETTIDASSSESLSSLVNNGDGTYTYTYPDGLTQQVIDTCNCTGSDAQVNYDCNNGLLLSGDGLYAQIYYLGDAVFLENGDSLPNGDYTVHIFTNNEDEPVKYSLLSIDCPLPLSCAYGTTTLNDSQVSNNGDYLFNLTSPTTNDTGAVYAFRFNVNTGFLIDFNPVFPDFPCDTVKQYRDISLTYIDAITLQEVTANVPLSAIGWQDGIGNPSLLPIITPVVDGEIYTNTSFRIYVTQSFIDTLNIANNGSGGKDITINASITETWGYSPYTLPYGITATSSGTTNITI